MNKNRFTNCHTLLLLVILLMSISCSGGMIRFPILNDVQLEELQVCEQEITQEANETGKEHYCGITFSHEIKEIFLCGEVSGIMDIDEFLGIFLYKDGAKKPIFYNTIDDRFTNGPFCRTIPLPTKDNREGTYRIELHHNRNILDSIEFEIR